VTLVLNRIDDRLIHGQVVVGWGQPLDVRFIVLVDDAVAESDWEKELYRMGVPPEMEVRFHSAAEAATRLDTYRTESHPGILLTGDIATMRELVLHGGVRDVAALGALVTAQDVPAARAIPLEEMLSSGEVTS
jgi:mannose/fructose/N-acetylgalactosamine-specific phosphotransferase system component IIB